MRSGQSLDDALTKERIDEQTDSSLIKEFCYGALRWYPRLAVIVDQLLDTPLKRVHSDVRCLLMIGLYQLLYSRIPQHAAVHETVAACKLFGKAWAAGLVNGVLRGALRNMSKIEKKLNCDDEFRYAHPAWLVNTIRSAWPDEWQSVLQANNARPPLSLRINQNLMRRKEYLPILQSREITAQAIPYTDFGIVLNRAVPIDKLPGFAQGQLSVQDGAAQLAAPLLDLATARDVLDACAAPGGKTCHIIEMQDNLRRITAVDRDQQRMKRVADNLTRLGLSADLVVADAANPDQWWDKRLYDRILLDAPCTGSGVIRRHPDIKTLRRPEDVRLFTEQQWQLLLALWPLLKSGGILLYVTCSILPAENSGQMLRFTAHCPDAKEYVIDASWGHRCEIGHQVLPGENNMDGFYYARLQKLRN